MTLDFLNRLNIAFGDVHASSCSNAILIRDTAFEAVKLHDRSPRCWAVIGQQSGAVADDENGALLLRLERDDARAIAAALNAKAANRN